MVQAPATRRVRPVWFVAGVLALVAACAFTALVVLRSRSADVVSPAAADAVSGEPAGSGGADANALPGSSNMPLSPTVIVLDASGSMKAEDAPGSRIDAAKRAVSTLVEALPDRTPLGLTVYGTSTDSSDEAKAAGCQDIRVVVPLGPVDRAQFDAAVSGVVASGFTPIGGALREAVAQLPADGPRNVVVVSDGIDTCAPPDACDVAAEVSSPGLAVHTVGFRVDEQARGQLRCVSDAAGGTYVDAANAAQLGARLRSAVDPNTAVNTLTRNGFGGVTLGMSVAEAKGVDPAITAAETGTVRIIWRNCELTFTDGTLTAITSTTNVATQDGLAIGDDVSRAVELYGAGPVEAGSGSSRIVHAPHHPVPPAVPLQQQIHRPESCACSLTTVPSRLSGSNSPTPAVAPSATSNSPIPVTRTASPAPSRCASPSSPTGPRVSARRT